MKQYPVEIPYSFSVDLNIKEQHIPFVQVSILTDNVEEEIIEFAPDTKSFNYRDTFYVYGDDTLLYFGDAIRRASIGAPYTKDGWIKEKWRAKYLVDEDYYGYDFVNWYGTDVKYRLAWFNGTVLHVPHSSAKDTEAQALAELSYSTLTIKRNTGLTTVIASGDAGTIFGNVLTHVTIPPVFADVTDGQYLRIISGTDVTPGYYKIITHTDDTVTLDGNPGNNDIGDVVYDISDSYSIAQGVNSDYEVPDYYTFPNLTRCEYHFLDTGYSGEGSSVRHYNYSSSNPAREIYVPRPSENINMSKVWLQIGLGRYRLKVYGKFYKWTNQQIKTAQTYPIATYTYVPYTWQAGVPLKWYASYQFSSKSESTAVQNLYEPEPNPCNVRLLINYLNNSGQNEIREYSL